MSTINKEHNTGRCIGRKAVMPAYERCCENYHHCGHQIPAKKLYNEYAGYCFTELVWKCPECGCENTICYKPAKKRKRRILPDFKQVEKIKRTNDTMQNPFSESMMKEAAKRIQTNQTNTATIHD